MGKYQYSELEKQLNNVIAYQDKELREISGIDKDRAQSSIETSEILLQNLGYDLPERKQYELQDTPKRVVVVPSWEKLCIEAEESVGSDNELEDIFTEKEFTENVEAVRILSNEYCEVHRLDKYDIGIAALAALIGAAVDILLVGIPHKTYSGIKAGPLSDYIRDYFEKKFPEVDMEKLANSKISKVPFDAQDNRNTKVWVEGLSTYYHRLLSLGHDPILGFVIGVADILNGTMTTIDKKGKIVVQIMENYADRKELDIFAALTKLIIHFKSDITTSMGLPAPLMGLFNLLQFGSIGEAEQTVAEIVQGMYYEGYDFIHFCSMSVPTMLVEVVVRLGYFFKRKHDGYSSKESISFSLNREKHPKLATMLFIGHSGVTAVNAGVVCFTGNPLAINYPQWTAFAKYSYQQLKWVLIKKPELINKYVMGILDEELEEVFGMIEDSYNSVTERYIIVFEGE